MFGCDDGQLGAQARFVDGFGLELGQAGRRDGRCRDDGVAQAGFGPEQGRPGVVIAAEEVRREVVGFADVVEELVEAAVEDEWQALQLFDAQ